MTSDLRGAVMPRLVEAGPRAVSFDRPGHDAEVLAWTGVAHGPTVTHPLRLADAIAARAR
ncbi:MAG: hypothetical protein JF586_13335 [Burkholderiales bacterium]|nr:hypothetical protein [Burkholderiales bacterium]